MRIPDVFKSRRIGLASLLLLSFGALVILVPITQYYRKMERYRDIKARIAGYGGSFCPRTLLVPSSVRTLDDIEGVDFRATSLDDRGLSEVTPLLREISGLRTLDLSGTNVSSDGLDHLVDLPRLENVLLYDTQVTGEGVDMVRRALPGVRIYAD